MGVLEGLEPQPVFHFFEEICKIPHGSGNEAALSDYLKQFAKERGLDCIQDEWKNIIITKGAADGYEAEETLILQGHMDMVAVKAPDCDIDMEKEPLRLQVNDDLISAEGTSLGGDDGIAVAYILALLDSEEIPHPRLEAVITVGEEVGMDGAREIDLSTLKGRRMLNLDNEEEGVLLTQGMFRRLEDVLKDMEEPVVAGFRAEDMYQVVGGTLRAGDRVHIYSVQDGDAVLAWEEVYVQQVFDAAGGNIPNGDRTMTAQRINVYLDKKDVGAFYQELAKGGLRVVKIWE